MPEHVFLGRRLTFMDDEELVEQVARDMINEHGPDAVRILRENADTASIDGDELSARAWRDIADAAERIVRESGAK